MCLVSYIYPSEIIGCAVMAIIWIFNDIHAHTIGRCTPLVTIATKSSFKIYMPVVL